MNVSTTKHSLVLCLRHLPAIVFL